MSMKDTDQLIWTILQKANRHPDYDGTRTTKIAITCLSEFEPWGERTEAFEDVWVVQLPPLGERWGAKTLKAALERALCWLECEEDKRP